MTAGLVVQVYFGLGLSLQSMAGPVHLNQAIGFAIEAFGCGVALLVMMRFGCRVTIAYSMLQGELDTTGWSHNRSSLGYIAGMCSGEAAAQRSGRLLYVGSFSFMLCGVVVGG